MFKEQLEHTIKNNFHKMTKYEIGVCCQERINSLTKFGFSEIKPNTVIYRHRYQDRGNIFVVHSVTPSGKQVVVSNYSPDAEGQSQYKIYSGTYGHYMFSEISGDDLLLIGLDHEEIIRFAVESGLNSEIPAKVKIEYPELFVDISDRFLVTRVKNTLGVSWCGRKFATEAQVIEWIEERHTDVRKLDEYIPVVRTKNPNNVQDWERYRDGYREDIDFFRWLQPHVSVGGVFYIEN